MNLRQIRTKIKAIDNIKKITNAMQLVSSVKMKKAQREYLEGKPYRDFIAMMVKRFSYQINRNISPLLEEKKEINEKLYIVIGSNKGLCGTFNYLILKEVNNLLKEKVSFIVWGKKITQILVRVGAKILADFSDYSPEIVVSPIFDLALNKFLNSESSEVYLLYNQFISATSYHPIHKKILPISLEVSINEKNEIVKKEYLVEPSPEKIIDPLLRNMVELQIRDAILSSQASEHSARMIAMKNATDNATELVYNLTLLRNRVRQEKITYELLDMITAKESINPGN